MKATHPSKHQETMRAMAVTPKGVNMVEIPKPKPGQGKVRVKVIAAAINAAEDKIINRDFVGRFLHAKTKPLVLGWDFSGTVDALGEGVTDIELGADVSGLLAYTWTQNQGTFAEYITVPRNSVAIKPKNVSHNIAAAAPTVSLTSLQSLRDLAKLVKGDNVLIIGASGGVGSIAVGIAKRLGGHVTGVCSTKDMQQVKDLGADEIINRKETAYIHSKAVYNVVFDTPAVLSYSLSEKSLKPGGHYITTLPNWALIVGMVRALFSSKHCHFIQVTPQRADLELINRWLSEGLEVPIDSHHKIANLTDALKRQTEQGRVGRVIVEVAGGW